MAVVVPLGGGFSMAWDPGILTLQSFVLTFPGGPGLLVILAPWIIQQEHGQMQMLQAFLAPLLLTLKSLR